MRMVLKIWRLMRGNMRWRLLWIFHAKFMVGVTGLVRNDRGEILLLRHRFWPERSPWGLPSGYAKKDERLEDTVKREVYEETGLEVSVGKLIHISSGHALRLEAAYFANLIGGDLTLDNKEVLEAQWFDVDALPEGLLRAHRRIIEANAMIID